jgi:UDP-N-acetyl-D-mannosaminuronic acid dehydrogenase
MTPSTLYIKPEHVDTAEKRGMYTVSIIGCNKEGTVQACLFAEAGFKVSCIDSDQTIINHLTRGKPAYLNPETESKLKAHVRTQRISATTDVKNAISQSDITIITTSVRIDQKKKTDRSDLENTCKRVGSNLRKDSIVIITGVVGVDDTRGTIKETLENTSGLKAGADFGLAYSPFRISTEQPLETIANQERIAAATDKDSLNATVTVLETIHGKKIKKAENLRAAEAATLFESAQQDVNAALTNEFAIFCEKAQIDYIEASKLMNPPNCQKNLLPRLTGGEAQRETYLFLEKAEDLNVKLRIPQIARETNEEIINHAVNLAKDALRNCGKTIRRARIALLGISQAPNMKDQPKEFIKKLIEMLEAKGAKINLYDPYFSDYEQAETHSSLKRNLTETLKGTDCIMILTAHDQFKHLNLKKLKAMMKTPAAILDFEGILEPDQIENEGFIYRGLGRGVWTK